MQKKKTTRRPSRRELDKLQIEEYIANNRHGPGDHTFTFTTKAVRTADKPKTGGYRMSARPKSRPIISLKPFACSVRPSASLEGTFFEVTFNCAFAGDAEPAEGTSISIHPGSLATIVRLAEASYLDMRELLSSQRKRTKAGK